MSAEFVVLFVAYGSSQHNKFFSNTLSSYFLRKVLPIIDLSTPYKRTIKNFFLYLILKFAIMIKNTGKPVERQRRKVKCLTGNFRMID